MAHRQEDIEIWHLDKHAFSAIEGAIASGDDAELPRVQNLPLIVREPQDVRFGDQRVTLDREGLYMLHRFALLEWESPEARPTVLDDQHVHSAVILFQNDLDALFAGLSTLGVHGWEHNHLSVEQRLRQMKSGLASITCGHIAEVGIHVLRSMGYHARQVNCLRVEGAYSARDDGHVLLEMFDPARERWMLVDLDMHATFARAGRPLNAAEVADLIHADKPFEVVPMTPPGFALPDTSGRVMPEANGTYMTFKLQDGAQRYA